MPYYIEVLSTNRRTNTAYVARSYTFKYYLGEIDREDTWFNTTLPLDEVEKEFGCKFDDGEHPYIRGLVERQIPPQSR